jgi:hypothetical protein
VCDLVFLTHLLCCGSYVLRLGKRRWRKSNKSLCSRYPWLAGAQRGYHFSGPSCGFLEDFYLALSRRSILQPTSTILHPLSPGDFPAHARQINGEWPCLTLLSRPRRPGFIVTILQVGSAHNLFIYIHPQFSEEVMLGSPLLWFGSPA